MKKISILIFILFILFSCKQPKTLSEQLTASFGSHLGKIDSLAVLDSVHIQWTIPVTQRLGRIIDDSVYIREFMRLQGQLAKARQRNNRDSIDFLEYEINYMKQEIDSVTRSIAQGD